MRNTKRHKERPNGQREESLTNNNTTMTYDTYGMETANCDISDISYSLFVLADNIRRARGVTPEIFGAILRAREAVQDAHAMINEAATAIVRAEAERDYDEDIPY